jgi:hypothetical protein
MSLLSLFAFIPQKSLTCEYLVDKSLCLMVILLQIWSEVYRRYLYTKYKKLIIPIWISEMNVSEI